jgi:endonuclease/exonuclease/phosphatase family metal-dependent hydrolase
VDTSISKGLSVDFKIGNEVVHLFGVHLKSERGGHEADAQRTAQPSIVRRNYLPRLRANEHVIVAGDLNDHPGQPAIRRIVGRDDIDDDLLQTGQARYFPQALLDTRWTYQFMGTRQQIDYVLISKSLRSRTLQGGSLQAETVAVTEQVGTTGQPATDHRAFVLNIQFAGP